jgi:WD40 repeat protein
MQALRTLSGHKGIVFRASFSPDSRLIATAGDDKIARIWESRSGAELLRLAEHEDSVTAAVFSPDGRQLATSSFDKTVRLWDLSSGAELKRLQGHSAAVWDVDFSPDSRYLYSIGFDGTVRQWDVETGQELSILFDGDVGPDLALSPDGRHLATTSSSGLVRVHVLSIVELVEQARSRLTRSLTPEECQRFLHQLPCPSLLSR